MKKIKICSMLTACVMLIGGLVGCGTGKETASNDIPTLTWYIMGTKPDDADAVVSKANEIIEEKIGARLDLQFIDGSSFDDKMQMIIASNKNFDLCYTADWANDFLTNVNKGAFMALDDLIDEYAPSLKTELPDYIYNASTVDGKIYAIPNLQVLFRMIAVKVPTELADKYGLKKEDIKELADFEPFFEKIKANEPDKYAFRPGTWDLDPFMEGTYEEILPATGCGIIKNADKTEIVNLAKTDEFKKAVETYRRWYEKGYIRQDINSVMDESGEAKAGKFAAELTTYKPGSEFANKKAYGREYTFYPLENAYLNANAGMSTMTAISRTSKNPEKAIKLIELMNTDKDLYNILCYGIEGTHYSKQDDGSIDDFGSEKYIVAGWMIGNQFNAYLTKGEDADTWDKTDKMNDEAQKSVLSGFALNTSNIKTELSQIATVNKEYSAIFNGSGSADLYEQYISKLDEAGQEKVREEIQKQVDEWIQSR